MKLARLWDRKQSPLPHLPWMLRTAFAAAPTEVGTSLVVNLIAGTAGGLSIVLTRRVIDALGSHAPVGTFFRGLVLLAGVMLLSQAFGAVLSVCGQSANEKAGVHTRDLVLQKSIALPLLDFEQAETYDLIARAGNVSGQTLGSAVNSVYSAGRQLVQIGSVLAIVWAVSSWVAVLALLVALPIGWAGTRQGRRMLQIWRKQTPEGRMAGYLSGLLSDRPAATELRAYQLLPFFVDRWRSAFSRQQSEQLAARWKGAREGWSADLAATALFVGALTLFTGQASRGALTAGSVVAIASAIRLLRESASGLAWTVGMFWEASLPLLDLRSFLEQPAPGGPPTQGAPFGDGEIRFDNVGFTYPGKADPVLHNVSLAIRPGERVALVGANGAGKSTLIKLLLGLYEPTAGRITVGGTDLRAIAPDELRRSVSCIFQDFARYDMTVAENIGLGRAGAGRDEVEAAARQAGADGLAGGLTKGYDTMLGKAFPGGLELSGGQWQKIALARAFVRDARLIVLDEPTAALDARAELEVFGKFVELAAGRTAVLISHRLGVTRLADRVIVLDGGQVAETGSHAELMAADGLYATLFRTQAQWYEGEGQVAS